MRDWLVRLRVVTRVTTQDSGFVFDIGTAWIIESSYGHEFVGATNGVLVGFQAVLHCKYLLHGVFAVWLANWRRHRIISHGWRPYTEYNRSSIPLGMGEEGRGTWAIPLADRHRDQRNRPHLCRRFQKRAHSAV